MAPPGTAHPDDYCISAAVLEELPNCLEQRAIATGNCEALQVFIGTADGDRNADRPTRRRADKSDDGFAPNGNRLTA